MESEDRPSHFPPGRWKLRTYRLDPHADLPIGLVMFNSQVVEIRRGTTAETNLRIPIGSFVDSINGKAAGDFDPRRDAGDNIVMKVWLPEDDSSKPDHIFSVEPTKQGYRRFTQDDFEQACREAVAEYCVSWKITDDTATKAALDERLQEKLRQKAIPFSPHHLFHGPQRWHITRKLLVQVVREVQGDENGDYSWHAAAERKEFLFTRYKHEILTSIRESGTDKNARDLFELFWTSHGQDHGWGHFQTEILRLVDADVELLAEESNGPDWTDEIRRLLNDDDSMIRIRFFPMATDWNRVIHMIARAYKECHVLQRPTPEPRVEDLITLIEDLEERQDLLTEANKLKLHQPASLVTSSDEDEATLPSQIEDDAHQEEAAEDEAPERNDDNVDSAFARRREPIVIDDPTDTSSEEEIGPKIGIGHRQEAAQDGGGSNESAAAPNATPEHGDIADAHNVASSSPLSQDSSAQADVDDPPASQAGSGGAPMVDLTMTDDSSDDEVFLLSARQEKAKTKGRNHVDFVGRKSAVRADSRDRADGIPDETGQERKRTSTSLTKDSDADLVERESSANLEALASGVMRTEEISNTKVQGAVPRKAQGAVPRWRKRTAGARKRKTPEKEERNDDDDSGTTDNRAPSREHLLSDRERLGLRKRKCPEDQSSIKVGEEIYCIYPENKQWYWARITKISFKDGSETELLYSVEFEDGDKAENIRRKDNGDDNFWTFDRCESANLRVFEDYMERRLKVWTSERCERSGLPCLKAYKRQRTDKQRPTQSSSSRAKSTSASGLSPFELWNRRCGKCAMCTRPECGNCASCSSNKGSKSTRKQCCFQKMCEEIRDIEKAQPAPGFPPDSGWTFVFKNTFDDDLKYQKSFPESIPGLRLLPPFGKNSFHSYDSAIRRLKEDIDVETSRRQFLEHIGVLNGSRSPLKQAKGQDHPLIGKPFAEQWIDSKGRQKIVYGLVTAYDREAPHGPKVTVEFSERSRKTVNDTQSDDLGVEPVARSERMPLARALGGCVAYQEMNNQQNKFTFKGMPLPERRCIPTQRLERMLGESDRRVPQLFLTYRQFLLTFTVKESSIPDAGNGVFLSCERADGDKSAEALVLEPGELIDLGVYAPFAPTDCKSPNCLLVKNFVHSMLPEVYAFDSTDDDKRFDITNDETGLPHDAARQHIPMYFNEVSKSDKSAKETVHCDYDVEGSIHYFLGNRYAKDGKLVIPCGESREQYIFYGDLYHSVRVRHGYAAPADKGELERILEEDMEYVGTIREGFEYRELDECVRYLDRLFLVDDASTKLITDMAKKRALIVSVLLLHRADRLRLGLVSRRSAHYEESEQDVEDVFSRAFLVVRKLLGLSRDEEFQNMMRIHLRNHQFAAMEDLAVAEVRKEMENNLQQRG